MPNHYEVARNWARQTGECQKGFNVFYDGDTIFSYGYHFPVARIVDHPKERHVLFTSERRSVTTEKHKTIVWQAALVIHLPIFIVPLILSPCPENQLDWTCTNLNAMADEEMKLRIRAARRHNPEYAKMDLRTARAINASRAAFDKIYS